MRSVPVIVSRFPTSVSVVLALMLSAGLAGCSPEDATGPESVCDPEDGGLNLADGFCATVVAEDLGRTRHLTVADNGAVYAAVRDTTDSAGIVALRDTDGDFKADRIKYFGDGSGTGIGLRNGYLYFGGDMAIWRYEKGPAEFIPSGTPETIVGGFPEQGQHAVKPFAFDNSGHLYVNVGAPSNACMEETRTKGSPGQDPCPLLEAHAGVWQYQADETGQQHTPDARYVSGIRNAVALTWRNAGNTLYVAQHGRDQLSQFFPDLYTAKENAKLPAEEFFRADDGDNFGWPYCYYDWRTDKKVLAPEYGGDGETVERCDQFEDPIQAFPGHWGPNDVTFYDGDQFPERYQNGAFIAWHGSWNRAPLPQAGYKVTFTPFDGDQPAGDYEVFADGFTGTDTLRAPSNAEHRPTGLAVGPEGGLYVSDDENGTIWRIVYADTEEN